MNAKFKTLGLAAAVAAGSFGMSAANAQTVSNKNLGDLAIVPYYSVKGDWVTGIHITNTADEAVAVKVRLRRDTDSADVLDFNIVMSPFDVWTGYLDDTSGVITWYSDDNSCTVPVRTGATKSWVAPNPATYTGAEEGYIEVISMGAQTTTDYENAALPNVKTAYRGALHDSAGNPGDCVAVESNFLAASWNSATQTAQKASAVIAAAPMNAPSVNDWTNPSDTGLKVSYFLRDTASGIEFGNNAVHVEGFLGAATMANQEVGLDQLGNAINNMHAVRGFEFPNLNGGPGTVGRFEALRGVLGGVAVMNDWSYATARGVSTDWVVTLPGQYLMVDLYNQANSTSGTPLHSDYRDLPVGASFTVFNREEQTRKQASGQVVVSPTPTDVAVGTTLNNEVNVIEWGPATVSSVLGSDSTNVTRVDPTASGISGQNGWASLAVSRTLSHGQVICDYTTLATYAAGGCTNGATGANGSPVTVGAGGFAVASEAGTTAAPAAVAGSDSAPVMVGFVAWKRTFDTAERNYGRIVEHSFR